MKKIIVLNHKSGLTLEEVKKYLLVINEILRADQEIIICPSSPYLPYFKGKYNFVLGAQNIFPENITGELTGTILKSLEVKYTLISTNDRKNNFEESSKLINKKVEEAIKNNIRPIITIGESFYEYELNKTVSTITKQIKEYLNNIEVKQDIIINYSPNWTYKGKQIPTENHIYETIELIKNIIKRKYNVNIKVIYGGNITKENIGNIEKIKIIDGYYIEKESTNLQKIKQVLNVIE